MVNQKEHGKIEAPPDSQFQVFADGETRPATPTAKGVPVEQGRQNSKATIPSSDNTPSIVVPQGRKDQTDPSPRGAGVGTSPNADMAEKKPTTNAREKCGDNQVLPALPEDRGMSGRISNTRGSLLLQVLGFAVELECSTMKARTALVAEWPGVGSLYELLNGKIDGVQLSSQQDLLKWTRQAAEGLVQACSACSLHGGGTELRLSTRNAYLFQRPADEFQSNGTAVFDVRVRHAVACCFSIVLLHRVNRTFFFCTGIANGKHRDTH